VASVPPSSRVRWADLRLRVLSATVLAPLALACLWLGGWYWAVLIALAVVGLGHEWIELCRRGAASPATRALGIPYIGLGAVALLWLRADGGAGRANVLFLVLVVWASDIGAYGVGRLVGGPRMAPAISPGKTWSGAAGGLFAAMAVGWLAGAALARGRADAPDTVALAVAAALGLAAQAGDLLESGIKRHFGVKDSGTLIPGHGGLFDRMDGMLAAAPVAALVALALGRGVVLWQ
jgi:phosphatidate cytidylyltransferase